MNKTQILKSLLVELEGELRRQLAANEQASAGATHGEARAETKWDTCGLEQSYLARGHAQQFAALVQQVEELRAFVPFAFSGRPIHVGALVEVDLNGHKLIFFILRGGGGVELGIEGCEGTVITPESPVGASLLDKKEGDDFSFRSGSVGKILSVK